MSEMTKNLSRRNDEGTNAISGDLDAHYPTPFLQQVETLVQRSVTNMLRARSEMLSSFGLACANLIFYGLFYLGLKTQSLISRSDLAYVQSLRSFIFQIVNGVCLLELDILARGTHIFLYIPLAFQEKTIFYRENAAGAYSSLAHHTSWFLRLTFMGLIRGILYPLLCYFVSGLTITFDRYIYFSAVVTLMSTTGSAVAMALVSAIPALEGSASAFSSLLG
jgi:hypothetical protein